MHVCVCVMRVFLPPAKLLFPAGGLCLLSAEWWQGLGGVGAQRLVTLHHIATLLETFVQNSPTLVQLMMSNFMEEFRYVAYCTTKDDDTSLQT